VAQILSPRRLGPWIDSGTHPVWIHAASLGELKGSIRLARALPADTSIFLTSTTSAGLRKLRREIPEHPSALLPLDESGTIRRFLDSIAPRCAIFLESEAWPTVLHGLSTRRIPVAFAAFRTGPKASARWRRFARLFPDWTRTVHTVWTDQSQLPESVTTMGFTRLLPGTSLKWAGCIPATPRPAARFGAAVSIHLGDLPQLGRLFRSHENSGWLWFPRRLAIRRPLAWFARFLGARVVSEPTPRPGEVWIASEFGKVRELLTACHLAWVSTGHDTEEPLHRGVHRVLTGSPAFEVVFDARDSQRTLGEILDWIRSV
jgi:hypothetical protein